MLNDTFQNCGSSIPLLDGYDDIPLQDLKPTSLDSFETSLNVNTFPGSYDINDEVLDLSQMPLKEHRIDSAQPEANIIDLVENIPLIEAPVASNVETFIHDVSKIGPPPFDTNEEVLKILKFLETQPKELVGTKKLIKIVRY